MHSWSETKLEKLIKKSPEKVVKYNQKQISRIYPKGSRIGSSNYDPHKAWLHGCQLVALNYQTFDNPMRFNQIKFEENNGVGYLLKPKILRDPNYSINNFSEKPTHLLKITVSGFKILIIFQVICAEQLPKPNQSEKGEIIDPYIKLAIVGVEKDEKEVKTKTICMIFFFKII